MLTSFWFADRLELGEVAALLVQVGSAERLFELVNWVVLAHHQLEQRELPLANRVGEQPVVAPDTHSRAVVQLEQRLVACVAIGGVTHWQLRARLLEALPGIIFPEPTSAAEFHDLVAAARNVNAWLAEHRTFRCGGRMESRS